MHVTKSNISADSVKFDGTFKSMVALSELLNPHSLTVESADNGVKVIARIELKKGGRVTYVPEGFYVGGVAPNPNPTSLVWDNGQLTVK